MGPTTTVQAGPPPGHRRNRSAVLKSIIVPKSHKRSPSDGTALNKSQPDARQYNPSANSQMNASAAPMLPPDHPHSKMRAQARPQSQSIPSNPPSPRKSQDAKQSPMKSLHKKTLSSVSLRSMGKEKEDKKKQSREPSRTREVSEKPKKTKSSTNLAAMFGKSKSKEPKGTPRDKENTTPPSSADAPAPVHTPIWAQFSSQTFEEVTTTSKVPLNDRRSMEEEINLYTPNDYSPSKQRNFFDYGQPSLQSRSAAKERPKSTFLPSTGSAASLFETLSGKKSPERAPLSDTKGNGERPKDRAVSKGPPARGLRRSSSESGKRKVESPKKAASPPKKANRVMAAVAAFNGKGRDAKPSNTPLPKLDPKAVEAEFEAVLESRNIPQHQRAAMRTLKLDVKADFVRTHKLDTPTVSRTTSAHSTMVGSPDKKSAKSSSSRDLKSRDGSDEEAIDTNEANNSSKRERPRSRTFTFSKGSSPLKKQKAERPVNDRKTSSKSNPIPKSPSVRSLVSNGSTKSNKGNKSSKPDEFITYMKKTVKPQDVEVGKLHKLRQLLRNETVEWVDSFVQEGGISELVNLLHRVMDVEWREDHEDQLLHEVLRCIKGLCTTDSALKQLATLASTLFPALLAMLFDEEHKGPSEFTTRELLVQIVFSHISTAPESEVQSRATELLQYLKDPVKEKETSTVPFILQMHQPRPYQVWCKEITNVTKEVFWIFIHHLNVIPLPPTPSPSETSKSYMQKHFPGPRAIVPAAPYVGGVEWDATNYIATHLDLINGLLAALSSRQQRNMLRDELKVSGFEKLMGQLRACNPKYYGAVHDAVKVWIAAAVEDGWDVKIVRMGPSDGKPPGSPMKSSPKKQEPAPQLLAPKMDLGLDLSLGLSKAGAPVKKLDDGWN